MAMKTKILILSAIIVFVYKQKTMTFLMKRHVITISFHMVLSIDPQALTLVYGTMKLQIIPIKTM